MMNIGDDYTIIEQLAQQMDSVVLYSGTCN